MSMISGYVVHYVHPYCEVDDPHRLCYDVESAARWACEILATEIECADDATTYDTWAVMAMCLFIQEWALEAKPYTTPPRLTYHDAELRFIPVYQ